MIKDFHGQKLVEELGQAIIINGFVIGFALGWFKQSLNICVYIWIASLFIAMIVSYYYIRPKTFIQSRYVFHLGHSIVGTLRTGYLLLKRRKMKIRRMTKIRKPVTPIPS